MKRTLFVLAIVLSVLAVQPAEAEGRTLTWKVTRGSTAYAEHTKLSQRLVHLRAGDVVTATVYYDNWAYITKSGEGSGWAQISVLARGSDKLKRCYDTTFRYTACAPDWISQAITSSAARYGVDRDLMMRIAACESSFLPTSVGTVGEIGIFQWRPETWESSNTVGTIHDTWDQSTNTARFLSVGLGRLWTCYRRIQAGL